MLENDEFGCEEYSTPVPVVHEEKEILAKKLIQVFGTRQIIVSNEVANIIASGFLDKTIKDSELDGFYKYWVCQNIKHVDTETFMKSQHYICEHSETKKILPSAKKTITILNCFEEKTRESWNSETDMFCLNPKPPSLLPTPDDYKAAAENRLQRAIYRLRRCRRVMWWSDTHKSANSYSAKNAIIVKPVEGCLGTKEEQCIVGILVNRLAGRSTEPEWWIEDSIQSLRLDLSDWVSSNITNSELFLHNNVVLLKGLVRDNHCFLVQEISHPFVASDLIDFGMNKHFSDVEPEEETEYNQSDNNNWLVFGECHLNDPEVLSNIYAVIQYETIGSGIILMGDFCSLEWRASALDKYVDGFNALADKLLLCRSKLQYKEVILVPGFNDYGPLFLPKFPVSSAFTNSFKNKLNGVQIAVKLASNPCRLIMDVEGKSFCIALCRANLIETINVLNLAVDLPFASSSFPTPEELAITIPKLIYGQTHLLPLPFVIGISHLYIARAYDHCFYLKEPFPDVIILADNHSSYSAVFKGSHWVASPGLIKNRDYTVLVQKQSFLIVENKTLIDDTIFD